MKLLAPAGDFECLKMAVFNGADEVYLGVKDFNARNNIAGFTLEDLNEVVAFAHLYGVKVHLTVNILFRDDELESALNLVVDAYNIGVDAFIIQDIGLAYLVHKNYPNIEMHASTQMGLHNTYGVKWAEDFGFKRVVLARETTLKEIAEIKKSTTVELEYFAHGALCVCFSGNCYLSEYLCDASGNRGKCKQLCRLPYKFVYDDKVVSQGYLLSAKDFNMIDRLKDLKSAGVCSLKIEGRARRPLYVGVATREYRKALDGEKFDSKELALAFNRGYTEGYFNGNDDILSVYNNHIGVKVGVVTRVVRGARFDEVYFSSDRILSPKSTFKVFDGISEVTVFTAYDLKKVGENLYVVTTTQKLASGLSVHLIDDKNQETELSKVHKKVPLSISVRAVAGEKICAKTVLCGKEFVIEGVECQLAKNYPLSEDEIKENFSKSEDFACEITTELDNAFLPKQSLNEFRRTVFETVKSYVIEGGKHSLKKVSIESPKDKTTIKDYVLVNECKDFECGKMVVYSPERYVLKDIQDFISACLKYGARPFVDLPNFVTNADAEYLIKILSPLNVGVVVNNYWALCLPNEKVAGSLLNVFNNVSAKVLGLPVLSGRVARPPYMTLRACPFKQYLKCDCKNCKYKSGSYFVTENGKKLKITRKRITSCNFYLND